MGWGTRFKEKQQKKGNFSEICKINSTQFSKSLRTEIMSATSFICLQSTSPSSAHRRHFIKSHWLKLQFFSNYWLCQWNTSKFLFETRNDTLVKSIWNQNIFQQSTWIEKCQPRTELWILAPLCHYLCDMTQSSCPNPAKACFFTCKIDD